MQRQGGRAGGKAEIEPDRRRSTSYREEISFSLVLDVCHKGFHLQGQGQTKGEGADEVVWEAQGV